MCLPFSGISAANQTASVTWCNHKCSFSLYFTAEDSDDNLWDISEIDGSATADDKKAKSAKKVTPEEFLGPNAKLVDFDDLVSKPVTTSELIVGHSANDIFSHFCLSDICNPFWQS